VRADIVVGSILGIVIAGFMIIANAATIHHAALINHKPPLDIDTAQAVDFARALEPLAGQFAAGLFGFGILNAGLFTATVLPLATAYIICEAFGLEAAVDRRCARRRFLRSLRRRHRPRRRPRAAAAGRSALPLYVLRAGHARRGAAARTRADADHHQPQRVMGKYVNSRTVNIIAWTTAIVIGGLAIVFVSQSIFNWP